MERVAEDFVTSLQGLDFATLEEAPHPVFGVDRSLALGYFNPAGSRLSVTEEDIICKA